MVSVGYLMLVITQPYFVYSTICSLVMVFLFTKTNSNCINYCNCMYKKYKQLKIVHL